MLDRAFDSDACERDHLSASGKKTLHDSIVVTFSRTAHAAFDSVVAKQLLELFSRVLTALIAMMKQIRLRPSAPDRHDQRVRHQIGRHP